MSIVLQKDFFLTNQVNKGVGKSKRYGAKLEFLEGWGSKPKNL